MWFEIVMTVLGLILLANVFFIFVGVVMIHKYAKEQNDAYQEIVRLNRLYHDS